MDPENESGKCGRASSGQYKRKEKTRFSVIFNTKQGLGFNFIKRKEKTRFSVCNSNSYTDFYISFISVYKIMWLF